MHHLTHMSRHMGCHNLQMPQLHNPSMGFSALSNQNNQTYTTNIENVNDARVVHYKRVSQMETKNNPQMNNSRNMRHQHQQIKKSHHYQHHIQPNINFQQKKFNKIDQNMLSENKLSHQLHLHKSDVPRARDYSSLSLKKKEKIENNDYHQITEQKIETDQFENSADTSSIEPKTKYLIKKCEIISKRNDNEKDITSTEVSSSKLSNSIPEDNILNNIEKFTIMSNVATAGSTFVQPDVKTYTNKKEQYTHEDVYEINKTDQVVDNTYGKIMEEEGCVGNSNQTSVKSSREKTPMCLINDLARFNKISFQYRLTSENGPAHCKRFTVTLKLGDEEYTAEEFKIKKAQHLAAKEAIEKTKYKHPVPKINRRSDDQNVMRNNVTPTVELNALAMKLGQQTYYILDPRQMTTSENIKTQIESSTQTYLRTTKINDSSRHLIAPRSVMINRDQNKVLHNAKLGGTFLPSLALSEKLKSGPQSEEQRTLPKFPFRIPGFQAPLHNGIVPNSLVSSCFPSSSPCRITLIVGTQKFAGIGRTLQQAKHDAATNALKVLKEEISIQQIEDNDESFDGNDIKSPISLVFEIGIKRNLPVDFKVLREEGPAHMRSFTTACSVGHILTEGEGTGKKISKKKAAQKMLEELKKLPPLSSISSPHKRVKLKTITKKAVTPCINMVNSAEAQEEQQHSWNRNKKVLADTESSNPITKLVEWHQQNKEKEPIFNLISEIRKENSRKRQFVIEVSSNKAVARGVGNSKKNAKRDAAQNFLLAIGLHDFKSTVGDSKKETETSNVASKEEKSSNQFPSKQSDSVMTSTKSSQIRDLEIRDTHDRALERLKKMENEKPFDNPGSIDDENVEISTRCIDRNSEFQKSLFTRTTSVKSSGLYMKDHLLYLAKLLGFEVDFSDYPKGNHNEFLTIVMLSTNPPQICHGVGVNAKESQDDAAKNALKILSEMGLNNAMKS